MNMRASGASELRKFLRFHILNYYFLQYSVGTYDTLSQNIYFSGLKLHLQYNYYTIYAVSFYMALCINDSTPSPTKH